jgi:hypothetical protein
MRVWEGQQYISGALLLAIHYIKPAGLGGLEYPLTFINCVFLTTGMATEGVRRSQNPMMLSFFGQIFLTMI